MKKVFASMALLFAMCSGASAQTPGLPPAGNEKARQELWRKMLPSSWLGEGGEEIMRLAVAAELSGGSIANVVRRCALQMLVNKEQMLTVGIFTTALQKELYKEGKLC